MGEEEKGRVSVDNCVQQLVWEWKRWGNIWVNCGDRVFIEESSLGGRGAEMKGSGRRRWEVMPNPTENRQGRSWDGEHVRSWCGEKVVASVWGPLSVRCPVGSETGGH